MSKGKYKVISSTFCCKEGYPHLCGMNIPAWELEKAACADEEVQLEYNHHANGKYIYTYVYSVPAKELHSTLENSAGQTYTNEPSYRIYLEYATGKLYASCSKNSFYKLRKRCLVRSGIYALKEAIKEVNQMKGNFLMNLVARTAIWAPQNAVNEQDVEKHKYVRRKAGDPPKGKESKEEKGVFYDDNTYPNYLLKSAVKKNWRFSVAAGEYSVCHIWENTCYDYRYHTDLRNLVLLPRALASLSDYHDEVIKMLQYHSYKLFQGWLPDGKSVPSNNAAYNHLPWLHFPLDK